ncbi:Uncharacterized protein APZ42_026283 [Daphnia magna]|uniref:Uncharacterized protein n=1 Tax=Daphnia magna TaxID=35525 RepID=A0A164SBX4_9CRUS|nr:Uncharacterized protein APZ42_026283 [Daphnia magna]
MEKKLTCAKCSAEDVQWLGSSSSSF